MTIVFGTETVRKFDRLEALEAPSNRTVVGVAKRCRHGLTGKEWSRDPVPTGCFDHRVSMIVTAPTPFLLEMSWPCGASARDRMRVATVSTPAGSSVRAGTEKLDLVATVLHPKCRSRFEGSPGEGFAGVS
jgi:hypothetical protein